MEKIQYQGHNYLVDHIYSENRYGIRRTYHVLTNNPNWACGFMNEVVGYPNIMSEAEHNILYKKEPTMANAFKPYWKCEFVEDDWYEKYQPIDPMILKRFPVDTDSYYVFTYIEPYDD